MPAGAPHELWSPADSWATALFDWCSPRRLAGDDQVADLPDEACGYIVGTYDKDAGANNQRLYLNGARVAQMSGTLPIDLNAAALGIGRHVSGIADPFNGRIVEFRISRDAGAAAG